jgi:hypothetical protein
MSGRALLTASLAAVLAAGGLITAGAATSHAADTSHVVHVSDTSTGAGPTNTTVATP